MDKKNDFRRWVGGKKNEFRWFYTPLDKCLISILHYFTCDIKNDNTYFLKDYLSKIFT